METVQLVLNTGRWIQFTASSQTDFSSSSYVARETTVRKPLTQTGSLTQCPLTLPKTQM